MCAPDTTGPTPTGQTPTGQTPTRAPTRSDTRRRLTLVDALVLVAYAALAVIVLAQFLPLDHGQPPNNSSDQMDLEWFLANGVHLLRHPQNPFLSRQMGAPLGVNLLDNTSMLGIAIPFAPLTAVAGAYASYLAMTALGLAGTAAAWYLLLSRKVVRSRLGAAVGGAIAGFGPGLIAHVSGQADLVINFLIPVILWLTFDVSATTRRWRRGVALGVVITYQMFLNQETLLVTAIGAAVFAGVLAIASAEARSRARPFLVNLAIAGGVAFALLTYPLWYEFFGPQHVRGMVPGAANLGTTLGGLWRLPSTTLGGHLGLTGAARPGGEQNVALGPALLVLAGIAIWLRRNRIVLAASIAGVVLLILSLGPSVQIGGVRVFGPYRALRSLPVFASLTPTRIGLALLPVAAVLIAVAMDRLAAPPRLVSLRRILGAAAVIVAVLPLVPMPVPAEPARAVPDFVATGTWHRYVDESHSVVAFPITVRLAPQLISWSTATNDEMRIANGYFVGPAAPGSAKPSLSPEPRPSFDIINSIRRTHTVPTITPTERAAIIADLRYCRAALVVVTPGPNMPLYRAAATKLFGPATYLQGAWIWDVRGLVDRSGT
ncbi:MAG TPA: hypothetical protein VFR11_10200 [Micromonosporaceae bacterium]|jgi:hypothetical protein|nr:hypothetical protein [Micromonosporaceae bacterium]